MSATGRNLPGRERRKLDQYMTPPWCVHALEQKTPIYGPVLDPCCGDGGLLESLQHSRPRYGSEYDGSLLERAATRKWARVHAVGVEPVVQGDALDPDHIAGLVERFRIKTIITNPPYKIAADLARVWLDALPDGGEMILLCRLGFISSQGRYDLYMRDFKGLYVLARRPSFRVDGKTDAAEYAWFRWRKGYRGHARVERCEAQ